MNVLCFNISPRLIKRDLYGGLRFVALGEFEYDLKDVRIINLFYTRKGLFYTRKRPGKGTLEYHCTRTAQSSCGGCSRRVHK